jgi:hypothetical protein
MHADRDRDEQRGGWTGSGLPWNDELGRSTMYFVR